MSHQRVTYTVMNPELKQEHLTVEISMGLCDGCGSGKGSFPWPAEGVDLKTYARERMKAKLRSNLGVDYDDENLIDLTEWQKEEALPESSTKEAKAPKEPKKTKTSK